MAGVIFDGKLVAPAIVVEKPVFTGEWQPNPNWWDIRKILDEDTRDYAGKVGVILYNFNDVSEFTLYGSNTTSVVAVATSDGAFYSYENDGMYISHNWDTSKDKDDGRGFKTRWVIYYYAKDTTGETFQQNNAAYGWRYNYIAYLVLRINCSSGSAFCQYQNLLEAIDNVGYSIVGTNFGNFCYACYSLVKLPDGLDTSKGTNFSSFCNNCTSLVKLPDGLDTSKGTNFNYFCNSCRVLEKLPDGLDTSKGTNFSNFCGSCTSLVKLPDGLDTNSGTNFNYFCYGCYCLERLPDGLDTSSGTNFSNFCGACYSLVKLPDGFDTSSGTDFSSFFTNCTSLVKLPDGLDTSKGTIFSSFCNGCSSLIRLPDGLDTGKGTNFNSFCYSCSSLQKTPEITMATNTTNITSKYSAPFYNVSWLVELPLTLPSNTNFWLDMSTRISIESFRYVADHAPDVTATPRTLTVGSTNVTRINAEDPTIITDLNAKGWTVA